jgi:hypothetical protein
MRQHITNLNLSYDKSFALYYPLPRFFYTSEENYEAIDRIQRGILKAFQNGSLEKLWYKEYGASVNFVGLQKRMIS